MSSKLPAPDAEVSGASAADRREPFVRKSVGKQRTSPALVSAPKNSHVDTEPVRRKRDAHDASSSSPSLGALARHAQDDGRNGLTPVDRESITEPDRLVAGVLRLNNLCQALSDTSAAVAAIKDRELLFREIGTIAVRVGQFKTAKIWLRDPGSSLVRANVCVGQPGEYLQQETRTIDLAGPEGSGPTGIALREGHPDVSNDLHDDERSLPWRDANARAGLRSSAAFPLREDGEIIGTLSVYSAEIGFFDAQLVEVLERIAAMLSLALDTLKRETQRAAAEASLRESEARFRSLSGLSADWYWQQDEHLCFTEVTGGSAETNRGMPPGRQIGKTRWDQSRRGDDEAKWDDHKVTLEAHLPFHDFEFTRINPDGSESDISISGEPIFDATGRFTGYRGIGKDITGRKSAERILALEHQVARILADAGDTATASEEVIRAVCEAQRWSYGVLLQPAENATGLRCTQQWGVAGEVAEEFFAEERALHVAPDSGMSGRVWVSGQPMWVADVSLDARVLRADIILRAGFHGAFSFPILTEGATIGVLTFFSREVRKPDERLLAAARIIGDQVGQFLQRRHAEEALRESEGRFRSLTELSADWYWQQDAQLRFTGLSGGPTDDAGMRTFANAGKLRWELPLLGISESQWCVHKAQLAARQPFRDFEFQRKFTDGRIRDISISGVPIFDAAGNFAGYRGIGRDITQRKREERILALEHRVARCLADGGSIPATLPEVLRAVCETEGFSCGTYRRADDEHGVLRIDHAYGEADGRIQEFLAHVRGKHLPRTTLLAGRVWQSGQPLWIADFSEYRNEQNVDGVLAAGLRCGFAFPSMADGATIGVFTFFSRDVREPNQRLLAAVRIIGGQVGQFLQRKHAEQALRESEARHRALTALSSDWYWEHDEAGRFTRMSEHVAEKSGITAESILGKTRWESGIRYDPMARVALEAAVDARQPFRDFTFSRLDQDGLLRHVSISGEPMFDAAGRYTGYRGIGHDITSHKLADDQRRFQAQLLNTVGDALIACTLDGEVTYWNAYAEQLYGWTAEEVLGKKLLDAIGIQASRDDAAAAMHAVAGGGVWRGQTRAQRRDGTFTSIQLTLSAIRDGQGVLTGVIGLSRDISDLTRAEHAIRENGRRQGVIADFGQLALATSNLDELLNAAVLAVADALEAPFCEILQFAPDGRGLVPRAGLGWPEGWMDRHAADATVASRNRFFERGKDALTIDDFKADPGVPIPDLLARHDIRSGVNILIGTGANPFGVLGAYSPNVAHFSREGAHFLQSIGNTLATAIDRTAAEEKVAYLAQFDTLTGLPNRNLFRDLLALTLTQAKRNGWNVGVMFIDLDGFKAVNDTFGHDAGDRLLVLVARRLQSCVRSGDTVGRFGGDEFGIVLANLARVDDANLVAKEVVDAFKLPFALDAQEIYVTASLGISVHPGDGDSPETLLKNADIAMYRAKEQGRGTFHFYTEELHSRVMRRMDLERELRLAIERQEFVLFYQPQVSLDSGRIVGVEALVRWQHPVRGLLAPAEFIAVAEETGLIVPIGRWVAETACFQIAEWHRRGHRDLCMAINVSPHEIRRSSVADHLREVLARADLDPRFLEIELTETLVMDGAEAFIDALNELKAIGITIAIDDFGTGYSSLSYLKRFPIDKIKIDRVFISDIVTEVDDAAIVQAVIAMSHHLKLRVIAEGVESDDQAAFLRRCQCDFAQGFLFSGALPAAELSSLLDSRGSTSLLTDRRNASRSLLIVDDEPNNLRALKRALGRDGYEIYTATSARQALEILAQTPVSVIMSDQRMPGMSGTELLSRAKTLYPDTVRIVLSGYTDLATVTAAINEGAIYKFLTKPWEHDALREDIRLAFHHHERRTSNKSAAVAVPAIP